MDVIGMTTILLFWTQVEVGVANVAICLPAMRPGRLITSARTKSFLNRVRMTWIASSKGDSSGLENRRSYIQQKDERHRLNDHAYPKNDDFGDDVIKMKTEGISKTVDVDIQSTARYPPQTEADLASRYELLQYPPKTAQKEWHPLETV